MGNIYLIIIVVIMVLLTFAAFAIAHAESKQRRKIEREYKELEEQERHTAEIIGEANEAKAQANSGDFMRDSEFMAQRLHHHATH